MACISQGWGWPLPPCYTPCSPLPGRARGSLAICPTPVIIGPLGAHCHHGHSPASRQDSCALCIRTWPGSWEDVSPTPGPRDVRSAPQRAGVGRGRPGVGGSPISTLRPWRLVKPLDPFSGGICKLITKCIQLQRKPVVLRYSYQTIEENKCEVTYICACLLTR